MFSISLGLPSMKGCFVAFALKIREEQKVENMFLKPFIFRTLKIDSFIFCAKDSHFQFHFRWNSSHLTYCAVLWNVSFFCILSGLPLKNLGDTFLQGCYCCDVGASCESKFLCASLFFQDRRLACVVVTMTFEKIKQQILILLDFLVMFTSVFSAKLKLKQWFSLKSILKQKLLSLDGGVWFW